MCVHESKRGVEKREREGERGRKRQKVGERKGEGEKKSKRERRRSETQLYSDQLCMQSSLQHLTYIFPQACNKSLPSQIEENGSEKSSNGSCHKYS